MPNVMGREFPYTPQGMAAAEQYKQAMGMRDGGMMGFRPLQMQGGGTVQPRQLSEQVASGPQVGADDMAVFQDLVDLTQRGSMAEVKAYVEANRPSLYKIANTLPPGQAKFVQNILDSFFTYRGTIAAPSEQGGNLGRMQGPGVGLMQGPGDAPLMSDKDLADLYRVLPEMTQLPDRTSPTDNTGEYLLLNPDMAPRQKMGPPEAGQPFRGGGLASLRHY